MKLSSRIFIGFFLVIFLAIIGFVINFKLSSEVNVNMAFLSKSESIIRNSARLHKNIIEMQSGFRGFLLTGNEAFLEPYYNGLRQTPILFSEQKLLIDKTARAVKLDSIETLHKEWIEYAEALINAKREVESPSKVSAEYIELFQNKLQKQVGKKINDEITTKFREFDRLEYSIREVRRKRLNESIETTRNGSLVLAILVIIVGLSGAVYITRVISRRILSMVQLADKLSKGQFELIKDEQSDELTDLSSSLNLMSLRLDKSFKELESKNRELDQFAYVVSHDLKAPLRGIYNIFHWIHEDLSNEISKDMQKYLEMMQGRVQRLENLITGLLEYARIGRVVNPSEKVSIKDMLKELSEMLVPPAFTFHTKGKMPVLYTDKIRLSQVFSNLISNAVKYNGNPNGKILVSCNELTNYYEFSVTDDGVGIPSEYHEKIFIIFQTLREKNEKESTGVGLAIVKKIIEDQKGSIKVLSAPGKGSSFIFTWPKYPAKELEQLKEISYEG